MGIELFWVIGIELGGSERRALIPNGTLGVAAHVAGLRSQFVIGSSKEFVVF